MTTDFFEVKGRISQLEGKTLDKSQTKKQQEKMRNKTQNNIRDL